MPLYEFKCETCNNIFDEFMKYEELKQMEDNNIPVICSYCGSYKTKRKIGDFGMSFKGPGFYKTTYPKNKK